MCVNQGPLTPNRKWMPPRKSNYRIKKNGTLEFHQYCQACYYQWHHKVHEFDQIVEKNAQLKQQLDQQEEIIAWQRFRLNQLERDLKSQIKFKDLFRSCGPTTDYELFASK